MVNLASIRVIFELINKSLQVRVDKKQIIVAKTPFLGKIIDKQRKRQCRFKVYLKILIKIKQESIRIISRGI